MKPNIYYIVDENTISANDIDRINKSNIEIKFLKWTEELEKIVTKLFININYYKSLTWVFYTNISAREKYKNFFIIMVENIVESIILNYSKLFGNKDRFSITKYLKYCKKNEKLLFKLINVIKEADYLNDLSSGEKFYEEKIRESRNKSFAHVGSINMEKLFDQLDKIDVNDIEKNIMKAKNILNEIWVKYCGLNLSFNIEKDNNISDITKLIENSCD